jgi:hypothetical protein
MQRCLSLLHVFNQLIDPFGGQWIETPPRKFVVAGNFLLKIILVTHCHTLAHIGSPQEKAGARSIFIAGGNKMAFSVTDESHVRVDDDLNSGT